MRIELKTANSSYGSFRALWQLASFCYDVMIVSDVCGEKNR